MRNQADVGAIAQVGGLVPALAADRAAAADRQHDLIGALRNFDGFLDSGEVGVAVGELDIIGVPVAFVGDAHALGADDFDAASDFCLDAVAAG